MKTLIIGGNRFVGLRLALEWDRDPQVDLHVVNRTGQVAHTKRTVVYKSDRNNFKTSHLDQDWDLIVDFACFTEKEAQTSLDYFKKVGRYILISTVSVYDDGEKLVERDFNPSQIDLASTPLTPKDPGLAYQFGKQRAEAVFAQKAMFPTVMVRYPFIVGPDDYTERLAFHVRRVESRQPIGAPNFDCRFSLIQSIDAAAFLKWAADQDFFGPINVASPDTLTLRELIQRISDVVGQKALLLDSQAPETHSPYGWPKSKGMDTTLLSQLGFQISPTKTWLKDLVADLCTNPVTTKLH